LGDGQAIALVRGQVYPPISSAKRRRGMQLMFGPINRPSQNHSIPLDSYNATVHTFK
jgi:hypothetical protein